MKKRILALALAATTAFSMLGASLSVSAADADEKFKAYSPVSKVTDLKGGTADAIIDELDKIYTGSASMDIDVANGNTYLFDFVLQAGKDGKLDAEAGGYATGADIKGSLVEAIANAYSAEDDALTDTVKTNINALITQFNAEYVVGGINYAIKAEFDTYAALAAKLDANDYKDTYDGATTEWEAYGLSDLKTAFANAKKTLSTVSPCATSQLIYLSNAFSTIDSVIGLDRTLSDEVKYDDLLAKIDELNEEDYTTASWDALLTKMDVAAIYADRGDFTTAYNTLNAAFAALKVNKPSVTELKALLDSLYTGGTYSTAADQRYYGNSDHYVYLVANNGGATPSFAWNVAFFDGTDGGTYKDAYGDTYKTSYFEKASDMYYNITRRANSEKHTQTEVDEVVADLEAAVAALSEGGAGKNWEILKLEELVAEAEAVEETDYRTSRTAWKNFVAALENAQEVLAESKPASIKITRVYDALEKAMTALKDIRLPASASDKATLKSLITEAKALLKDTDDMVLAQVTALEKAVAAGESVYKAYSTKLISEVAAAIENLEAAINYGEVIMGWNKLENGTYKYGTADGYVTSDWKWIGNAWYYFDAEGIMVTGWQQLDGAWYYFYTWGGMAKGWAQVNGTWYYLNPNGGKMLSNGWNWINGKCYYFYSWGGMAANTTIDGYKVDASGAWVK